MNLWTVGCADPRLTNSAVPCGQGGENAMRFPRLAHRSAAAHKLHSTPQQDRMNLISGKGETSSRLPAFSLFLPGSCPNYRDRRTTARSILRVRLGIVPSRFARPDFAIATMYQKFAPFVGALWFTQESGVHSATLQGRRGGGRCRARGIHGTLPLAW